MLPNRVAAPDSLTQADFRIQDDSVELPDGQKWYAAYEHVDVDPASDHELNSAAERARDRMLLRAHGEGYLQDGRLTSWAWRHMKNGYWTVAVEMHARKEAP